MVHYTLDHSCCLKSICTVFSFASHVRIGCGQVEVVKKFNIWLFHLALGKCFALPKVSGEGTKNYYILPCKLITNDIVPSPEELIDWQDVEVAVNSCLLYRSKVHFFNGYAKLDSQDTRSDHVPEVGVLRMRNGIFQEHDLEDALVTCANNGLPCYIYGILHDLSGYSVCPQPAGRIPMTYSEHYIQKYACVVSSSLSFLVYKFPCPSQYVVRLRLRACFSYFALYLIAFIYRICKCVRPLGPMSETVFCI